MGMLSLTLFYVESFLYYEELNMLEPKLPTPTLFENTIFINMHFNFCANNWIKRVWLCGSYHKNWILDWCYSKDKWTSIF